MTDILNHIDQGVMTLTFNRVDKKNSITSAMYASLADALEQAQQNADVRVVLIQGHETIFSAGNDIADFLNNPPADQNSPVFRFLRNISTVPQASVGRGGWTGGGHWHHFAVSLRFGVCGRQRGFLYAVCEFGFVPRSRVELFGAQHDGLSPRSRSLLMGEPFMAEAALEVGLVNRVVPPTEVNAYAQTQARKLANKPLSSLIETKRLMKAPHAERVKAQMAEEGVSFGRMLREPAAKEAFGAFMEKRKPDFSKL